MEQKAEVDRNYDSFQRQLANFLGDHRGDYALLHNCEVIGFFKTVALAYADGISRFKSAPFSIQEVTDEPLDLGFISHAGD